MDDEVLNEFINESREHLATIETDLLAIEEAGAAVDPELVNKVFRAAHSIKGGSAFFGLGKVKELAHKAETLLDMLRAGKMVPNPEIINVLLAAFDKLRDMINDTAASESADIADLAANLSDLASSYLPQEQKASLSEMLALPVPGGGLVRLPRTDVERCQRTGKYIYLVDCDLLHDIEQKGVNILDLFRRLNAAGEMLECVFDFAAVGTLDDDIGGAIPLRMVVASVAGPDVVVALFQTIAADRIHLLLDPKADLSAMVVPPPAEVEVFEPLDEAPVAAPLPVPVEMAAPVPAAAAEKKPAKMPAAPVEDTLRVHVGLLENLMNLAGELVLSRNQLHAAVAQDNRVLLATVEQRVNQVTSEIQDVIMQTRLQPIGNVFAKFPRVVRDLSQALGKEIDLEVDGKDVALDKTLIEGLSDPLTHMVRNAVDHGIETVEERRAAGKSPMGKVKIRARHEAGQVVVEIADDGKGIDPDKMAAAVVAKGLMSEEKVASLSVREKQALVFLPGFSTATVVSDISGRGVGMDVVKTNLDHLGGQVEIVSEIGKGSSFLIKMPLTLAIIPSLIVSVGDERFAIPQTNIDELIRIRPQEIAERIETVGDAKVLLLRDRILPLTRFQEIWEAESVFEAKALEIVIVSAGPLTFALAVDRFHDTEEIVVKPLGRRLKGLREYSGATILGDGTVALIVDIGGLAEKAGLASVAESARELEAKKSAEAEVRVRDVHSLLLFYNSPEEPCAVPLDMVRRIEQIEVQQVEKIGHLRTMQYRGGSLPLITLGDAAQARPLDVEQEWVVLVATVFGREVGLLGAMPVDVVETEAVIDDSTHRQTGVSGSAIIDGRTTLIVDLHDLVEALHPDWAAAARRAPERRSAAGGGKSNADELVPLDDVSEPDAPVSGSGAVVLLAEDSDFFRAQIKKYLEAEGYTVLAAPDGEAAWDVLMANVGRVRGVVTDIEMPHLDGLGLTRRIRGEERTAALPVIAVTTLADEEHVARGREAGVDDYQIKLNREDLMASVNERLRDE
jgi:two-component system, chemotaxis family, sensor kinase CheA